MRIAVVSESFLPTVNGVTTSVLRLLDHLAAAGHEALVICPDAGAPREYAGFPVHPVPAVAYRQFPVGLPNPHVAGLIARFEPDVLHAASPFLLGAQGIAAANRLGVPSVAIFQTDVAGYARRNRLGIATGLAWRLVRWVHEGADLTLAPSSASMAQLAVNGIRRTALWGRGVDLERYHPNNRALPAARELRELLSPDGEVVIGYVGRLAPEKQVERFRALRRVHGIRLAIVGDGPSYPLLQKELRGVPVTWLGRRAGAELAAAYASFDVFAHAGTEETFGQTVQEAHASGIPVIAPRAGGPIDLVRHGENGYLFEPDDETDLRRRVQSLVTDAPLRRRMGESGRRDVLGRSWNTICDELFCHYTDVIEARSTVERTGAGR